MKKISIFLLLLLLSVAASAQDAENFVGYTHKGVIYGELLPNGAKDLGGGLLSDDNYGISRFSKGKTLMLWLEKITARDEEGVPDWEVKDVLSFEKLKKNREFHFSYSSPCTLRGAADLDLVVMADFSPKRKIYKVVKAWKIDFETEKFAPIPADDVKCEYIEP